MLEGMFHKKAPAAEKPGETAPADNVVKMPIDAEKPGIVVRDSLGNVVGSAATPEEARRMQVEANVNNREAA